MSPQFVLGPGKLNRRSLRSHAIGSWSQSVASINLAEKWNLDHRLQFRQVDGTDRFSEVNLRSAPYRTRIQVVIIPPVTLDARSARTLPCSSRALNLS